MRAAALLTSESDKIINSLLCLRWLYEYVGVRRVGAWGWARHAAWRRADPGGEREREREREREPPPKEGGARPEGRLNGGDVRANWHGVGRQISTLELPPTLIIYSTALARRGMS